MTITQVNTIGAKVNPDDIPAQSNIAASIDIFQVVVVCITSVVIAKMICMTMDNFSKFNHKKAIKKIEKATIEIQKAVENIEAIKQSIGSKNG